MPPRDVQEVSWDRVKPEYRDWFDERMAVYAAQIDQMDRGIGRILAAAEAHGGLERTLVVFLADNGGCAEEIGPKGLRKRPVLAADAPAFIVNRVLTRMTAVLMDALEHGNTVDETDEAILRLGMPMAPSVLLQMVGPRVANHVLETLHEAYPDRFPLSETLRNYA